jgi:hypothetical protein
LPNLEHYPRIRLDGLRKTTKTARIAGYRSNILTRELPNTKQECKPRDNEVRPNLG